MQDIYSLVPRPSCVCMKKNAMFLLHANLCSILNSGVQLLAKTFISFLNNPVINATLRECREDICTTATAILVCYAAVLSV